MLEVVKGWASTDRKGILHGITQSLALVFARYWSGTTKEVAIMRIEDWQRIDSLLRDIGDGKTARDRDGWLAVVIDWSREARAIYTGDPFMEIPPDESTTEETAPPDISCGCRFCATNAGGNGTPEPC